MQAGNNTLKCRLRVRAECEYPFFLDYFLNTFRNFSNNDIDSAFYNGIKHCNKFNIKEYVEITCIKF